MRILRTLLPHASIVLALMFITFFIVDKLNGAMNFINNDITKALLLLFSLIAIGNSCLVIAQNRRQARRRSQEENQKPQP